MQATEPEFITALELAELSQEPYTTIDHWSELGLLRFNRRGRRRKYEATSSLERCRKIRSMQEQGMNLVSIKKVLAESA